MRSGQNVKGGPPYANATAAQIKAEGARIFVIGIGDNILYPYTDAIASAPASVRQRVEVPLLALCVGLHPTSPVLGWLSKGRAKKSRLLAAERSVSERLGSLGPPDS